MQRPPKQPPQIDPRFERSPAPRHRTQPRSHGPRCRRKQRPRHSKHRSPIRPPALHHQSQHGALRPWPRPTQQGLLRHQPTTLVSRGQWHPHPQQRSAQGCPTASAIFPPARLWPAPARDHPNRPTPEPPKPPEPPEHPTCSPQDFLTPETHRTPRPPESPGRATVSAPKAWLFYLSGLGLRSRFHGPRRDRSSWATGCVLRAPRQAQRASPPPPRPPHPPAYDRRCPAGLRRVGPRDTSPRLGSRVEPVHSSSSQLVFFASPVSEGSKPARLTPRCRNRWINSVAWATSAGVLNSFNTDAALRICIAAK